MQQYIGQLISRGFTPAEAIEFLTSFAYDCEHLIEQLNEGQTFESALERELEGNF